MRAAAQIAPNKLSKKPLPRGGGTMDAPAPTFGIDAGGTGALDPAVETPRRAGAFKTASPPLLMVSGAPTNGETCGGDAVASETGTSGLR